MQLTLIRHAIAEEGDDDFSRPLTNEGWKRFCKSVVTMRELEVSFTRVVHSPKLRAVETAKLLTQLLDGEFEASELLMKAPSKALLSLLAQDGTAAVGHEPYLSSLLAWLVMGDVTKGQHFELKKGAVARLEGQVEPGGMQLTALWTPKLLRR
ncbi:MAG: SixA phosphatase family protein [Archangium sp.]